MRFQSARACLWPGLPSGLVLRYQQGRSRDRSLAQISWLSSKDLSQKSPAGATSKERYDWISTHLANAVEEAIKIRGNN
jgi:hypothetical protein